MQIKTTFFKIDKVQVEENWKTLFKKLNPKIKLLGMGTTLPEATRHGALVPPPGKHGRTCLERGESDRRL